MLFLTKLQIQTKSYKIENICAKQSNKNSNLNPNKLTRALAISTLDVQSLLFQLIWQLVGDVDVNAS